jgi:hypothetical protein
MFYYQSEVTDEYINTVVNNDDNFEDVKWGAARINPTNNMERSVMAREFLLDELRVLLGNSIQVKNSAGGYPVILRGDTVLDIVVSLAHDGEFAGWSVKAEKTFT